MTKLEELIGEYSDVCHGHGAAPNQDVVAAARAEQAGNTIEVVITDGPVGLSFVFDERPTRIVVDGKLVWGIVESENGYRQIEPRFEGSSPIVGGVVDPATGHDLA